uniref:Uncharacterized protein n=1 Tax=Avena sativa TaxID=4498 RepID=A0ACD6ABU5_AVESA
MVNSNYSALPLTSPAIELQSSHPPTKSGAAAAANGAVHAKKLTKQDSFLGEVDDDDGADNTEHDELPLMGGDGPAGPPEGSGVSGAVFNLATSIIGAGIMALPATMKVLGVAVGLVSILVMGVLSEVTIELLVRFSARCRALSYGELVHRALGRPASVVAQMCIIINNAGVLVVYLIIIGDVMSGSLKHMGVIDQLIGHDGEWDNRRLLILFVLVLFLAPLCALERIDSLSLSSAASVALAIVFVLVSCVIAAVKLAEGKISAPRMGPDFSSRAAMLDLLVVIPIMTNAFICHFNVQPIYNELKEKTPSNMYNVGRISTVLCVAVYALTAVSGYLLFGDDTESDVLTNFDKDLGIRFSSVLNYIVRIGYIIHLVLVFPVVHFSLRQTVDALVFGESAPHSRKKMLALTAVLLALIYLGSTMIPNIWMAFKFTGATTGLALGFMFPALMALRLDKEGAEHLGRGEKLLALGMLGLAIVVSIVGVAGNVYTLKSKSD